MPRVILLLYAHPHPGQSVAGQALLAAVRDLPELTVHSLYDVYPDFSIDAAAEQRRLAAARLVIWQHPLYWYGVPALLKLWWESVLVRGWAYGDGRSALHGKDCLWVTTTGALPAAYTDDGVHGHPFHAFVPALRHENGTVQGWLDRAGFAYTGSNALSSGLAMDKNWAKHLFRLAGLPTPRWLELRLRRGARRAATIASVDAAAIASLGDYPVVVKPNAVGSPVGVSIVREPAGLRAALLLAARYDERVLVEEFIPGRELTVTVLEGRAFPVVEIIPTGEFYDYRRKYTSGASRYEAPASIPEETARHLQDLSVRTFSELRCRGVARVDYRLDPDAATTSS